MNDNQCILVTGSHRSGTTWTGRNLALAPNTAYVHEPFNVTDRVAWLAQPFPYWFYCVADENQARYRHALDRVVGFHYPFWANLRRVATVRDLAKLGWWTARAMRYRLGRNRLVLKDPIAFFSAEWLARTYGMQVVVMIRHPAAFCSSLKIKQWSFDFNDWLRQPVLMDIYLSDYADEIRAQAKAKKSVIEQGILLWNCIHQTAIYYQQQHSDWLFVRHEDLSVDPVEAFRELYDALGLTFTPRARAGIEATSGAHNPQEQGRKSEFRRDSVRNITNWQRRLSVEEIELIRERTAPVAEVYYDNASWLE